MKKILLSFFVAGICISCSKNEKIANGIEKRLYVSKITNISSSGSTELTFTYDSKNRLIKNETDTYYREFIYGSGDKVITIKSTTKPSTLYYTISFIYNNDGSVKEVKRDNHYNSTIYYTKYDYYNTGEVNNVYVFTSLDSYNNNKHDRYYDVSGYSVGRNFTGKLLNMYNTSNNFYDPFDDETWSYDGNNKPYFGEPIETIAVPYATDGTGMDWDIRYQSSNPVNVTNFSFISGANFTKKTFEYVYNSEQYPTKMVKKTYLPDGSLSSTFTQDFTYVLR